MRTRLVFAVSLACLALAALAQRPGQMQRLPPGAPPAVQVCVGCHGEQGQGNPQAGAPRLAGQAQRYLLKQLDSYAEGTRRDRVMEPIARGLPPEVRTQVAAYYAALEAPAGSLVRKPPPRGQTLAEQGDNSLGVQACRNCHGPGGVGEPPNIPYLAGLDEDYIAGELRAWKEGTRTNDAGQQMLTVASALPEADIQAVARYYASVPPPAPAPADLVREPSPGAGPSPAPPKVHSGQPPDKQPPGVEQGAPTEGGAQGPGGTDTSDTEKQRTEKKGENGNGQQPQATQPPRSQSRAPEPSTWPGLSGAAPDDASADSALAAKGRALVESGEHGCPGCHTIPGIRGARGVVGPSLAGFARRALIAGQLPNDRPTLEAFLQNPPELIPQTGMPDVGLTRDEARQIAAFLNTLEGGETP